MSKKTWVQNFKVGQIFLKGHALFARNRDCTLVISQLLKVVDTCFWAQNVRNMQVYISTYTNAKL